MFCWENLGSWHLCGCHTHRPAKYRCRPCSPVMTVASLEGHLALLHHRICSGINKVSTQPPNQASMESSWNKSGPWRPQLGLGNWRPRWHLELSYFYYRRVPWSAAVFVWTGSACQVTFTRRQGPEVSWRIWHYNEITLLISPVGILILWLISLRWVFNYV